MSTSDVYQFHVWLRGISPLIWRRLLLRSDQTLADLHDTLQISFGWSDFHLHRFRIHGRDFGVSRLGGSSFYQNANQVLLAEFHFRLGERFLYEYDFGDQWEHQIRLDAFCPFSLSRFVPSVSAGSDPTHQKIAVGEQSFSSNGTKPLGEDRSCWTRSPTVSGHGIAWPCR